MGSATPKPEVLNPAVARNPAVSAAFLASARQALWGNMRSAARKITLNKCPAIANIFARVTTTLVDTSPHEHSDWPVFAQSGEPDAKCTSLAKLV
jgi:hypothetical protein